MYAVPRFEQIEGLNFEFSKRSLDLMFVFTHGHPLFSPPPLPSRGIPTTRTSCGQLDQISNIEIDIFEVWCPDLDVEVGILFSRIFRPALIFPPIYQHERFSNFVCTRNLTKVWGYKKQSRDYFVTSFALALFSRRVVCSVMCRA